jgi:phosphate/sulfate permease
MSSSEQTPHKRLSGWWALLSVAVGCGVAFAVGQIASDGGAEIAGIMVAMTTLCTRAFWDFHVRRWFLPLVAGWVCVHALILIFLILPMQLHRSKSYFVLVWAEFFVFAGAIFLACRFWGGVPDEA